MCPFLETFLTGSPNFQKLPKQLEFSQNNHNDLHFPHLSIACGRYSCLLTIVLGRGRHEAAEPLSGQKPKSVPKTPA